MVVSLSYDSFFSITYVKHVLAGIVRFRTVMPYAFLYIFFLRFRKVFFAFLWHFLIDALRFHNTTRFGLWLVLIKVTLFRSLERDST